MTFRLHAQPKYPRADQGGGAVRLVTRASPLGPQSALWVMGWHQGRDRDWPESPETGIAQAVGCTMTLGL